MHLGGGRTSSGRIYRQLMQASQLSVHQGFSDEKLKKHNLFSTPRLFLDVYCLRPGQSQRPHAHPRSDKVYLVLEGRCRFTVGGAVAEHGEGVAVLAPAGESHGVENAGNADARLLVLMTPPPEKGMSDRAHKPIAAP